MRQPTLRRILLRIMPQMNENWVNDYDAQTLIEMYQQIDDYFTNEVVKEVLSKYDNSLDFKPPIV